MPRALIRLRGIGNLTLVSDPWKDIRRFQQRMANPSGSQLQIIESAVRSGFAENFRTQSSGGNAWAPLAPWTRRERAAQGYGAQGPMLQRGGSYRRSWTNRGGFTRVSGAGNGFILEVGSNEMTGRRSILESGGVNALGKRVPARPVRFLSSPQEQRIGTSIEIVARLVWKGLGVKP
jgi:hypothetical protein